VCACSLSHIACNTHAPYYTVIWGLSWLCHIFPHYLLNGTIKKIKKLLNTEHVFWIYLQICLKCFSLDKELSEILPQMYTGLHVKYPLFTTDFNQTWIFLTDFQKIIKFHQYPHSGCQVVPCTWSGTEADGLPGRQA
jgi:hypothetical protein